MRDARYVRLISWTLQSGSDVLTELGVVLAHVSSIAARSLLLPFWGIRPARLGLGCWAPSHTFPGLVPCQPGSRQSIWFYGI